MKPGEKSALSNNFNKQSNYLILLAKQNKHTLFLNIIFQKELPKHPPPNIVCAIVVKLSQCGVIQFRWKKISSVTNADAIYTLYP